MKSIKLSLILILSLILVNCNENENEILIAQDVYFEKTFYTLDEFWENELNTDSSYYESKNGLLCVTNIYSHLNCNDTLSGISINRNNNNIYIHIKTSSADTSSIDTSSIDTSSIDTSKEKCIAIHKLTYKIPGLEFGKYFVYYSKNNSTIFTPDTLNYY